MYVLKKRRDHDGSFVKLNPNSANISMHVFIFLATKHVYIRRIYALTCIYRFKYIN